MLLEFVPEKPRNHIKLCKKMKKRKQLDALVSGNKPNKRFKNSTFANSSSHGLLKNCSDSSDLEDFSINRKRRPTKHVLSKRMCNAIFPAVLFILVTACIIATATLVWLHLVLRSNLEVLRLHLQKVESTGEETPRSLHSLHGQIQKISATVESLQQQLDRNSATVAGNQKELTSLHQTSDQLKESLASAPELHGLPKTVQSLSENLASIGSKILALETTVKDAKAQLAEQATTRQQETSDLDLVKASVQQLWKELKTQKRNVAASLNRTLTSSPNQTSQLLSQLQEEVSKLSEGLVILNSSAVPSLNQSLVQASDLLAKQQGELGRLRELVNSSSEHPAGESSFKNLFVNCNVSAAHVTSLLPQLEELAQVYSYLRHLVNVTSSSPPDFVNATANYFLESYLKMLVLRMGALEVKAQSLQKETDSLKLLLKYRPSTPGSDSSQSLVALLTQELRASGSEGSSESTPPLSTAAETVSSTPNPAREVSSSSSPSPSD